LPGRAADDCVTNLPANVFKSNERTFILHNGSWVTLHSLNWPIVGSVSIAIDYNGDTSPNLSGKYGGANAVTADVLWLLFNRTNQKITSHPSFHGTNYRAGSLVGCLDYNNGSGVYNYWMGLD
jgi:hypothetical protein